MRYRYSVAKGGKLEKKAVIYTSNEHGINFADIDSEAIGIIKKLKKAGYDTYIVGGAVRDLILGKKPKDFDIVSAASPVRIKKIFRNSRIIGRRFRLVHVYFGQRIFEVSTFRSMKDGSTSNTFGEIEEDVKRRDFTLNALFYDPEQQIVVDYIGGMNDIKRKVIKPIIAMSEIFTDDPVRMIRAVKYAAKTDFSLPLNLRMKIAGQSSLLAGVSPSRLTEEIFKIIHSEKAASIVELLDKMGLYVFLQPGASFLMRKDAKFKKNYMQSLTALAVCENRRGQALGALFYDYLDSVTDWKSVQVEHFKDIYKLARNFILPMNPPRFELETAVKKFLSSRGITIKKTLPIPAEVENGLAKPKRKRKRRKKSSKEAMNTTTDSN
ncbi:MAG: polynucleotide adenylyltransferase PcnB [Treponema sp.]|nr:polynucleotide adenylyltransferase PcnB [Treponema sp.]